MEKIKEVHNGRKNAEESKRLHNEKRNDFSGDVILAGVSGGGDSMAMLGILRELKAEMDFTLLAVHVHHGIRGKEADRDAVLVENTCKNGG